MILDWLDQLRSIDIALSAFAVIMLAVNEVVLHFFARSPKANNGRMQTIEACMNEIQTGWKARNRQALKDKI